MTATLNLPAALEPFEQLADLPRDTILIGDCRDWLRRLPDNSVGALLTDPPYGLNDKMPDAAEVLTHWLAGDDYTAPGTGFMSRKWDAFVPGPAIWREVARVLKPGAWGAVFCGDRTADLMGMALRLAGLEVKGMMTWAYSTGFPKNRDVPGDLAKAGDDLAAEQWAGWGTAYKPAFEVIWIVRKPTKLTFAANISTWGVGAVNIDGCRVGTAGEHGQGRHPSNMLLGHTPDCRIVGLREVKSNAHYAKGKTTGYGSGIGTGGSTYEGVGHRPGVETVEDWSCADGCPVADLETQKPGGSRMCPTFAHDTSLDAWPDILEQVGARFRHCAKPSTKEKEAGLEHFAPGRMAEEKNPDRKGANNPRNRNGKERRNTHPTVKPWTLLAWLATYLCPPGEVLLDPFLGSGTTGVAATMAGHTWLGMELSDGSVGEDGKAGENYVAIAGARIAHALTERDARAAKAATDAAAQPQLPLDENPAA